MAPDSRPRRRLLAAPERAASILAAAAAAFARNGYAATTIDEVAAAAGVSKLIVYRHFNSKRELYQAILDQVRRRLDAIASPAAEAVHPGGGEPAIRAAAEELRSRFAVARELPDGYRLLYRHAAREPEFAGHAAELARAQREGVMARLGRVADPAVREWLAGLVTATVAEAFLSWLDLGDPERDDEMVDRVAYLLAGMVGSLWTRAAARGEPA